jgi:hypothetical protein
MGPNSRRGSSRRTEEEEAIFFLVFFFPFFPPSVFFSSSSCSLSRLEGGGVGWGFGTLGGGDVELYVWLLRSMASGPGVLLLLTAYSGSERLQIWIRILLSACLFCPNIKHVKLTNHTLLDHLHKSSQMYFFSKYDKKY